MKLLTKIYRKILELISGIEVLEIYYCDVLLVETTHAQEELVQVVDLSRHASEGYAHLWVGTSAFKEGEDSCSLFEGVVLAQIRRRKDGTTYWTWERLDVVDG